MKGFIDRLPPRRLGLLEASFGTLAVTPDAVLLRLAEMHGGGTLWVVASMKLFAVGVLCSLHPLSYGLRVAWIGIRAAPRHVLLAALGQGLINMGYSLAFITTTVAEALMLISLHPLWGALGSRIILGDRIPLHTAIALGTATVAVLIIFVPPAILESSAAAADPAVQRSSVGGNLIALFTGLCLALTIIVNRHAGIHRPQAAEAMELAAGLGSLGCGVVSLAIACSHPLAPLAANPSAQPAGACSDFDQLRAPFWLFIGLDGLCIALCTILTTVYAPRHLFGAECGIILLGEQVLSPVWVYLGVGEAPTGWTLGGGAVLILTLAGHEAAALVQERREAAKQEADGQVSLSATEVTPDVSKAEVSVA